MAKGQGELPGVDLVYTVVQAVVTLLHTGARTNLTVHLQQGILPHVNETSVKLSGVRG